MSELKRVLSQHHAQEMRGKLGGSAMCICGQGCGSTEACGEYAILLRDLTTATAKIEALEAKLATAERLLAESTVIEGKGWSISNNGNPAKLITLRQYDGEGELLSYTHHNSILEAFEALEPKENTDVK
mgnify:CR=1 FL=1